MNNSPTVWRPKGIITVAILIIISIALGFHDVSQGMVCGGAVLGIVIISIAVMASEKKFARESIDVIATIVSATDYLSVREGRIGRNFELNVEFTLPDGTAHRRIAIIDLPLTKLDRIRPGCEVHIGYTPHKITNLIAKLDEDTAP